MDFTVDQTVTIQRKNFIDNSFVGTTTNIPVNNETVITYNNPQQSTNKNGGNGVKVALMFGVGYLLSRIFSSSNRKETVE